MVVSDETKAAMYLEQIGYYRLSGFWYPFRKFVLETTGTGGKTARRTDDFKEGTDFRNVVDLYVFDRALRLLFLDAIERTEVALRVDIALRLGARHPCAHRIPTEVHGNFSRIPLGRVTSDHDEWLGRLDLRVGRAKEEFVEHFRRNYEPPIPLWVVIELWDFGLLSTFASGMKWQDLQDFGQKFGVPRPELFTSWLRAINHVRNICAHHGRLWNRTLVDQPKPPKQGEIEYQNHWIGDSKAREKPYCVAVILKQFLDVINPTSTWGRRLKDLARSFPSGSGLSLRDAGFPENWEQEKLWE